MSEARGGGRTALGLILTILGIGGLAALFVILDLDVPGLEAAPFRLGLALTALLSGAAQVSLLIGLWLLWTSRRRL